MLVAEILAPPVEIASNRTSSERRCQASESSAIGRYQVQAAIQSAHVVRRRTGSADWAAIERLCAAGALDRIINTYRLPTN